MDIMDIRSSYERRETDCDRRDYPRIPLTDRRSLMLNEALLRQMQVYGFSQEKRAFYMREIYGLISFSRRHPKGIRKRHVEMYLMHRIEHDHATLQETEEALEACKFLLESIYGMNVFKNAS